jgi:hypothetical protein
MGTRSLFSFTWMKRAARDLDHPSSSNVDVNGRVQLYLYYTCGTSWTVLRVKFTFTFT